MRKVLQERRMLNVLKEALRAWIRADAEQIPPLERQRRLSEARRLTGEAVSRGLLERPS